MVRSQRRAGTTEPIDSSRYLALWRLLEVLVYRVAFLWPCFNLQETDVHEVLRNMRPVSLDEFTALLMPRLLVNTVTEVQGACASFLGDGSRIWKHPLTAKASP